MNFSTARILAVIPARGGSKRLVGKNIRPLANRPLLAYSILTAQATDGVETVVVSSDCPSILGVARQWGATPVVRPAELSGDSAPTLAAMRHALLVSRAGGFRPTHVALFQPTCPLRHVADVNHALEQFFASHADSALTVNTLHLKVGRPDESGWFKPAYPVGVRKQDLPADYQENGAFYVTSVETLDANALLGPKTLMLHFPREAGIASIDDLFDFQVNEALYHQLGYEREFADLEARRRTVAA